MLSLFCPAAHEATSSTTSLDVLVLFFFIFLVGSILLVLVFGDQVTDVLVCFLEFHLVHTFTLVPMEESLSPVHSSELSGKSLEDALQGRGVGNEGGGHVGRFWLSVDDLTLKIVRNPFNEVIGVL